MRRMIWGMMAVTAMGLMVTSAQLAAADGHRGGTLRLLASSAAGTLDPKINYQLEYWTVYQYVYDGLVTFKQAAGEEGFKVVPDLAEAMPMPKDGGKTYVFRLRKGIRFADGRPVTIKDVVASFQRIFKVSSPTAGSFYNGIVGAEACLKTPATCTLAGGVVGDEAAGTITIHLVAADAEFFDKLAVPHAVILPADTPAKDMGSTPIVGTGAYMFAAYDPNRAAADRAQSLFQGMEQGRPARRLSGRDPLRFWADRAGRRSRLSRTARPTGPSTNRRRTGWPRSARSTRTRCISTR